MASSGAVFGRDAVADGAHSDFLVDTVISSLVLPTVRAPLAPSIPIRAQAGTYSYVCVCQEQRALNPIKDDDRPRGDSSGNYLDNGRHQCL